LPRIRKFWGACSFTASACLEGLDGLGLGEETKRLFLYETARRVFKIDRGP